MFGLCFLQEDTALLCSQSTEDLVSDTAWCALVTDLGDETLLKKYSLASILYQVSCQLFFCYIETLLINKTAVAFEENW